MKKVLVTNLIMQRDLGQFKEQLDAAGIEPALYPVKQFLREEELLPIINQYDGMIAGDDQLTEKVLSAGLPRLKVISKWGVGLDSIDLKAAEKLGVKVYNSPGAFADAVAEVAICYMLMLSRKLHIIDNEVRHGKWPKLGGEGLKGKVLGIIGFGSIGRSIAEKAKGFGLRVVANDVYMKKMEAPDGIEFISFEKMLSCVDFLCLSCNLTSDNRGFIGEHEFAKMKQTAFLINMGRGALVSEPALISALNEKSIAGAALDVYEVEPLSLGHPFTQMENVVLGSHNANNMKEANEYVNRNTIKNLIEGFSAFEAKK